MYNDYINRILGRENNYLRFPSKWEVIMKNARKFAECPRTRIMFATTVNALTIGYLPEIADGVYELRENMVVARG